MYRPRGFCCCCCCCPRVSDAVRVVPIRGFSALGLTLAPGRSRSKRGGRAARTEADRPPRLPLDEFVLDLSVSGGGVGGNTLRFSGGSECWRVRMLRFFCTRLLAPYEMCSGDRSSSARWSIVGGVVRLESPYPVSMLLRSAAAISLALPK